MQGMQKYSVKTQLMSAKTFVYGERLPVTLSLQYKRPKILMHSYADEDFDFLTTHAIFMLPYLQYQCSLFPCGFK